MQLQLFSTMLAESVETLNSAVLSDLSSTVDWSQFVPEVIATFLGFGLALFGQWLWERFKDKSDAKNLKKRIASELKRIKNELNNIEGIYVEPLKIPIWDTCISTGNFKVLDVELQEKLALVYSIIREYNSWSLMQSNYYFENKNINNALDEELKRLKCVLLGNVDASVDNVTKSLEGGH